MFISSAKLGHAVLLWSHECHDPFYTAISSTFNKSFLSVLIRICTSFMGPVPFSAVTKILGIHVITHFSDLLSLAHNYCMVGRCMHGFDYAILMHVKRFQSVSEIQEWHSSSPLLLVTEVTDRMHAILDVSFPFRQTFKSQYSDEVGGSSTSHSYA